MESVVLQVYNNYIDAHIVFARLKDSGIRCWLKDEHVSSVIVDPILTNAIGGIKLMVARDQVEQAIALLNEPQQPLGE